MYKLVVTIAQLDSVIAGAGGHNYIGFNYTGHNYIDHNYIGHNYIDSIIAGTDGRATEIKFCTQPLPARF